MKTDYDVIIIGGGFYGTTIALSLRNTFQKILIIEKEADLLQNASYINQARIHHGYHYPRSFPTALSSQHNYQQFLSRYGTTIYKNFKHIYAISRQNSKISAQQFENFCRRVNLPLTKVTPTFGEFFNPELIEQAYVVDEVVYDAVKLKDFVKAQLNHANVKIHLGETVQSVYSDSPDNLEIVTNRVRYKSKHVYNCAYSGINSILKNSLLPTLPIKCEITEEVMVEVPEEVAHLGITVMDGPFFSILPFPSLGDHCLTHVRYTPHAEMTDDSVSIDFKNVRFHSNYQHMVKDATRYCPILKQCRFKESLFTIKTLLKHNEIDDGRPILFKKDYGYKDFHVVLGGKIDNIFDILPLIATTSHNSLT